MFSQQYISALVIVIVGILGLFKINAPADLIESLITTIAGVWVMVRRYKQGDITLVGRKN